LGLPVEATYRNGLEIRAGGFVNRQQVDDERLHAFSNIGQGYETIAEREERSREFVLPVPSLSQGFALRGIRIA
jgi:hypothetical protein